MPDSNLADASVLSSTFYNTYIREQVVVTCTSATHPSGVEGRLIFETDTDKLMVHNGSTWVELARPGAWTSWTPTLAQGATGDITKTVTYAAAIKFGRAVLASFHLDITGAGTAGADITITLPHTAVASAAVKGGGWYYDASTTTRYTLSVGVGSTAVAVFENDASGGSGFGTAPSFAVASGDILSGFLIYEAAS